MKGCDQEGWTTGLRGYLSVEAHGWQEGNCTRLEGVVQLAQERICGVHNENELSPPPLSFQRTIYAFWIDSCETLGRWPHSQ